MKRWLKRVGLALGALVLVLASFLLIEHFRGRFALPSNLEALVPKFMAALPNDRMDGELLRYMTTRQNSDFVLYSVGEDGIDDGGDPSLRPGKEHFGQMWDGKDAVWPSPASAQEASEEMTRSREP